MRRVLMTGVTGYIGGRLASNLVAQGIEVIGVIRPESQRASSALALPGLAIVPCEAGFAERLKDYRPEVLFHLAAHTDRTRAAENTQKIFAGMCCFLSPCSRRRLPQAAAPW
jgi:nucleoside-diphosphate-sugar epimerase